MSKREDGYYWISFIDGKQEIAEWSSYDSEHGAWLVAGSEEPLAESTFRVISARIETIRSGGMCP